MSFSEWKKYKVGDFAEVQNGYAFKATEFADKGIPVIKIKNIVSPKINLDDTQYFNGEVTERMRQFLIRKNDVLISMTGSHLNQIASAVGKVGKYQFDFPALLNQRVGKVYVKNETIGSEDFLYYFLNRFETQLELVSSAGGSANQANISPTQIKNLSINLPDLKTQQRIASILSSLDDAIELNQQINKTLEAMAKAIFKEWFVDFNFPNATGKFQETEIGKIPVGWEVGKLGNVYKTTSGGTPSRAKLEYYENGIYQWVKSKELNNSFIIDTEERITEDALKKSSAKLVPKYSVMIAMYGATVGEIGIISNEATCNQAICAFLPNNDYPFSFIYQVLLLNKQDIISQAVGSAQQNISQQLLLNYALAIPPSETVKAFHKIVEPLFFQIEQSIKENQSLMNLRDTLLPKLMKGEIEINKKEVAI